MQDAHIHLTTQPLYDYREHSLHNYVKKGGKYILNTSNCLETCYKALEIHKEFKHRYPNLIQSSLGIHPEKFFEKQTDVSIQIKELRKVVNENIKDIHAIGECGLEYHNLLNQHGLEFKEKEEIIEKQKAAFREQINIAKENNLPMTIHTRDEKDSDYCTQDMLHILVSEGNMNLRGCMHCYVGNKKFLKDFLDIGLYIGFNAIITYKSGINVRELVKKTPTEKILLETDAPFLPTQNTRKDKKRVINFGQPEDILEIAKAVGEIKGLQTEEVIEITTNNYKNLFIP